MGKIILLFLFSAALSYGTQESLPPEISKQTRISGDVILSGDCLVAEGGELIFAPGARIIVQDGEVHSLKLNKRIGRRIINAAVSGKASIIVEGRLMAASSDELPVVFGGFTASGASSGLRWGGIVAAGNGEVALSNVRIKDAVYGVLACDNADVLVKKSVISNCGMGLIAANNSNVRIISSDINRSFTSGVELYDESSVSVEKTKISRNGAAGILAGYRSKLSVSSCEIESNKTGIRIKDAASYKFKDNFFYMNDIDVDSVDKYKPEPLKAGNADFVWKGLVEVKEDFTVPFGKTLRILEGTKIFVSSSCVKDEVYYIELQKGRAALTTAGKCDIIIKGNIIVSGTEKNPVFLAATSKFGSIILSGDGKGSGIFNLVLSGAERGIYLVSENAAKFKDCVFKNCGTAVIIMERASPAFEECVFLNDRYGVISYDIAKTFFRDSIFSECEKAAGARDNSTLYFRNCRFEKGALAAATFDKADISCVSNSFNKNVDAVLLADKSSGNIERNNFSQNFSAVRVLNGACAQISANTFVKNENAVLKNIDCDVTEKDNSFVKNKSNSQYLSTKNPTASGVIGKSEVWDGRISVVGDILVRRDAVLYIKSGAKISLKSSEEDYVYFTEKAGEKIEATHPGLTDIIVEGHLITEAGNEISFLAAGQGWGGIIFVKDAAGEINDALLKNASSAVALYDKSSVRFNGVNIAESRSGLSLNDESSAEFVKSRIVNCGKGIEIYDRAVCDTSLSILTGNDNALFMFGGGVSSINNLVSKNKTGIKVLAGRLEISNNSFLANETALEERVPVVEKNSRFYENLTDRKQIK